VTDSKAQIQERTVPDTVLLFIERVDKLERGDLAILKRNAGQTIAQSRNAMSLFYRILPPPIADSPNEEIYFLVATLMPHNKHKFRGNFGMTMKAVKKARAGSEAVDRRMGILLDSEFDLVDRFRYGGGEMAYRLRQCVKLAASNNIGVDWAILLDDLIWWSHHERRVRKRWARSYYAELRTSQDADS